MVDLSIGAVLVIVVATTSATPANVPDETRLMTEPFATMGECRERLIQAPLSDNEQAAEREQGIRVLRACLKPADSLWFSWRTGEVVSSPGATAEAGAFTGR